MVHRDVQSRIRGREQSSSRPLGRLFSGHNDLSEKGVEADSGHGERSTECGTSESEAGSFEYISSGLDENVQNDLKPNFAPAGSGINLRFESIFTFLFSEGSFSATEVGPLTTSIRNSLVSLNDKVRANIPQLCAKYKEHLNTAIVPIVDPAEVRHFIPNVHGFMLVFPTGTDTVEVAKLIIAFAKQGSFSYCRTQKKIPISIPKNKEEWTEIEYWTKPATCFRSIIPIEIFNQSADISDREREERVIRKLYHAIASAGLPKPEAINEVNCSLQKKWQWVETRSSLLKHAATFGNKEFMQVHCRVLFSELVRGPVTIGHGRNNGTGLLVPVG